MTYATIAPERAKQLVDQGALLIDVREPDEHAREQIPGARNIPLAQLDSASLAPEAGQPVIFHCRSGLRTMSNAQRLTDKLGGAADAYILEGGLDAWKKSGLPVATDRRQPLELQRQVQIGAGGMVLVGTVLGVFASPWFLVIPAFVGAGLTMAGVTGFCGLALMLRHMPWNRALLADGPKAA
jgi:rhodanese-related sulfurtransferase